MVKVVTNWQNFSLKLDYFIDFSLYVLRNIQAGFFIAQLRVTDSDYGRIRMILIWFAIHVWI